MKKYGGKSLAKVWYASYISELFQITFWLKVIFVDFLVKQKFFDAVIIARWLFHKKKQTFEMIDYNRTKFHSCQYSDEKWRPRVLFP